jgi:hypothetical protein
MSWMSNTCTIRTTMALNNIGVRAGDISNARWKDKKRQKYLIRVKAMTRFLRATFGPPAWTAGKRELLPFSFFFFCFFFCL